MNISPKRGSISVHKQFDKLFRKAALGYLFKTISFFS